MAPLAVAPVPQLKQILTEAISLGSVVSCGHGIHDSLQQLQSSLLVEDVSCSKYSGCYAALNLKKK